MSVNLSDFSNQAVISELTKHYDLHSGAVSDHILEQLTHMTLVDPTSYRDLYRFRALSALTLRMDELVPPDFELLPHIRDLTIVGDGLEQLDLRRLAGHSSLETLTISGTGISTLTVDALPKLRELTVRGNSSLSALTITRCPNLCILCCDHNVLTALTCEWGTGLQHVDCTGNLLGQVRLMNLKQIKNFICSDNPRMSLLMSANCDTLDALYSTGTQLSTLMVENATNLTNLSLEFGSVVGNRSVINSPRLSRMQLRSKKVKAIASETALAKLTSSDPQQSLKYIVTQ